MRWAIAIPLARGAAVRDMAVAGAALRVWAAPNIWCAAASIARAVQGAGRALARAAAGPAAVGDRLVKAAAEL
ncbi:MAG: hypothetical protein A2092_02380 [Rhodobacteraceae bacterium GWE1_64_9]|nr:MAG: hypothetical protein A2092_02380 [Rhodobacteraceae bacterium GWE1_64_9]OHC50886.1 MAG: hypothetical protein A2X69_12775 [Rhodobacteraceae bacterium GWF1_65_7]HBD90023.1 hypothetical protein [Gemmobacter sp.]HBU13941.1 hypothetical protein [Gemmobacter sp.]